MLVTSLLYALGHVALGLQLAAAQFPAAVVLWLVSFGISYYLGAEVAPGLAGTNGRPLFRAMAYANVPRALVVLLLIPGVGVWLGLAAVGLTLAAYTPATMETSIWTCARRPRSRWRRTSPRWSASRWCC